MGTSTVYEMTVYDAYCHFHSFDLVKILDPRCPTVFSGFKIAFILIIILSIFLAFKYKKRFLLLIPLSYILFGIYIYVKAITFVNQGILNEHEVAWWVSVYLLPFQITFR